MCGMTTGPLRGKRHGGRTHPRGSEGYYDKPVLERAERVERYLVARGIDPALPR
jgi:outer membrane protein OmpA-like peptidoglycan-associated protein